MTFSNVRRSTVKIGNLVQLLKVNFGQMLTVKPVGVHPHIKCNKLQEAFQNEIQFICNYDYGEFNVNCPVDTMKSFRQQRTLLEYQTDICTLNALRKDV